jgi:ABC-2 type transport system permease protein
MRLFLIGGLLSYRALFNWLQPAVYLPTMLGKPLFQIVFFTILGRYSAVGDDRYFVVGNAVATTAMAGIYGMVMTLANEREFGTLPAILASPANRFALYVGRTVPVVLNGLLVSAFGFGVGFLVLGVRIPGGALAPIAATVAVTSVSCTLFGLALGAVALRLRDLWVGSNLASYVLLLACGGALPVSAMPGWLAALGRFLPLTHGIEAARRLSTGAGLSEVSGLIGSEALVGLAYGAIGYGLLRYFEAQSRRRAFRDAA